MIMKNRRNNRGERRVPWEQALGLPDEPGAEMQHDTSPFTLRVGAERLRLQASLLYLRYSKRRYLQFRKRDPPQSLNV
jgi:hypothetical protein